MKKMAFVARISQILKICLGVAQRKGDGNTRS